MTRTFKILILAASSALVLVDANAIVMAVTGDAGNGSYNTNSFYEIDTDTGASTLKGSASVVPNQLAFDASTDNLYYMDHAGSNFYRFDLATNTESLLGDLTTIGMPSGKTGSGGGDFYNGVYYYTPETGSEFIYAMTFSDDGSIILSHNSIVPGNLSDFSDVSDGSSTAGIGDFGDFAIDPDSGVMYGSSNLSHADKGGAYRAFWSIDLTTAGQPMTMIDDSISNVYQLAFDVDGNLWGNRWRSGGALVEIDPATGSTLSTTTLQLDGSDSGGDFYDLASTGVREGEPVIPEPSSYALCLGAIALIGAFRRRR